MIERREIIDLSGEFGIEPNIVEKDYVLGWMLAGIYNNHSALRSEWLFKGGTCLKKCFFETYRFSEDLDFTITNSSTPDPDYYKREFIKTAQWLYDTAGIEILKDEIRFEVFNNPRGKPSCQGKIKAVGPTRSQRFQLSVKLDLTFDEITVLPSVQRKVHHPYSDNPENGISAQCYSFEEVFAEKIRALAERLRPRDLYDVVHLFRHGCDEESRKKVLDTLKKKCEFKGIPLPSMDILNSKPEHGELVSEWENMLAHQLPVLPPFEEFWKELPAVFDWLYKHIVKPVPQPIGSGRYEIDRTWQPPAMVHSWNLAVPLEKIRFAGTNRLCVNLGYQGSLRLIEPYSLKRTNDGNILLYAIKSDTGAVRAYRVDRIESVQITNRHFVPRYAVEFY